MTEILKGNIVNGVLITDFDKICNINVVLICNFLYCNRRYRTDKNYPQSWRTYFSLNISEIIEDKFLCKLTKLVYFNDEFNSVYYLFTQYI